MRCWGNCERAADQCRRGCRSAGSSQVIAKVLQVLVVLSEDDELTRRTAGLPGSRSRRCLLDKCGENVTVGPGYEQLLAGMHVIEDLGQPGLNLGQGNER